MYESVLIFVHEKIKKAKGKLNFDYCFFRYYLWCLYFKANISTYISTFLRQFPFDPNDSNILPGLRVVHNLLILIYLIGLWITLSRLESRRSILDFRLERNRLYFHFGFWFDLNYFEPFLLLFRWGFRQFPELPPRPFFGKSVAGQGSKP